MTSLTAEVKELLKAPREGIALFVTVGNSLRGDDGAGPYVSGLCSPLPPRVAVVNVGQRPEEAIDAALRLWPRRTVFIDAADFGAPPGEVGVLGEDQIAVGSLSTHSLPLPFVGRVISEETGSEVHYLGIQVKTASLGEGLSPEVRASAEETAAAIRGGG